MSDEHGWLDAVHVSDPDRAGRVLLVTDDGPVARVPDALGRVVRAAQSARSTGQLPPTDDRTRQTLESLGRLPALARTTRATPHRGGRLRLRPPFSVQLTLLNPDRVLAVVPAVPRLIRTHGFQVAVVILNAVAAVGALTLVVVPTSPVHRPLSVTGYFALLAVLVGAIFVHELAHAATLVAHGGTSRRMGFMLFYLMPAFFCDVSDAWRLTPNGRVKVALAGVLAQGLLAFGALGVLMALPPDTAAPWAAFVVVNTLYAVLNLVPFIKLDGYIAVVGWTDEPNLRARCMAEAQAWGLSLLRRGGTGSPGTTPGRVLFGMACAAFPVLVVGGALVALGTMLSPLGRIGTFVLALVVVGLLAWVADRMVRRWRDARRDGRAAQGTIVAVASVVAIATLLTVPLPATTTGGYTTVAGNPVLVTADRSTPIPPGSVVDIHQPGLLRGPLVGSLRAGAGTSRCAVPVDVLVPVSTGGSLVLDAWCTSVTGDTEALPQVGHATIPLAPRSIAARIAGLLPGPDDR